MAGTETQATTLVQEVAQLKEKIKDLQDELTKHKAAAVLCCRDTYSTARFMRDQLDWVETHISGEVFEFLVVHSDNCSSTPARF